MGSSQPLEGGCGRLAEIVASGSEALGVPLPPGAAAAFAAYYACLEKCGRRFNLTAIEGESEVARLHFLDSVALLKAARLDDARVIDIGSGAGFPGVPMKIAEPSIDLTLLDATAKRIRFLDGLCAELGLDATCVCARAEDSARAPEMRQSYDAAVSRAVARLNVLCELCLPFVKVGGVFIAMKGVDTTGELPQAHGAIEAMGARLQGCFDYELPGTDIVRRAVIIRKTSSTPDRYPRRFARIQKSPL